MLKTLTEHEIITTTARSRYVDWNDIEARVEYDDDNSETPWYSCDGWEHEFVGIRRFDERARDGHAYVNRAARDGGCGFIVVDDAQVIAWGCKSPYTGASRQACFEYRAQVKRRAVEQLVQWYENGWEWFRAVAEWEGRFDALHGIDCEKYAAECAEECRWILANELECEGFIIRNRPAPKPPYSRVEAMRDRIRRQLTC